MEGKVVRLSEQKKFGFIIGEDGLDYFFHQSDLNGFFDDLLEDLGRGLKVAVIFDIVSSDRGPRAGNVTRIDEGVIR